MCQTVLLHMQLCVFLNNASAERLNVDKESNHQNQKEDYKGEQKWKYCP